jgi:hypothetical protein
MNNDKDKRLDEMLDAALAEYGNAEPLHGIEDRVLARLQAEPARRPWWIWGAVAAGAAAVAIAAALMMHPEPKQAPAATAKQQLAVTQPKAPAIATEQTQHVAPVHAQPAITAHATRPSRAPQAQSPAGQPPVQMGVLQVKLPRRDVFPTPTPPSMEEILLARHVRMTPSDVVLAEAEREPLKFHYDDVPVPATHAGPQKEDSTK